MWGGQCEFTSACKGTTKAGLCSGPADFQCCFPASTGSGAKGTAKGSGAHSLSTNGVKFIAGFEGFKKDFYLDAVVSIFLPPP